MTVGVGVHVGVLDAVVVEVSVLVGPEGETGFVRYSFVQARGNNIRRAARITFVSFFIISSINNL